MTNNPKIMADLLNNITRGDSFELISMVDNSSIDLLLTDPPYFFSNGYKDNDWDNIEFILTENEKEQFSNIKVKNEKTQFLTEIIHSYFSKFIDVVIPKLKDDASLIIFNKLEHVEFMQEYLNTHFSNWESHIFEWSKTNPSPKVKDLNKSEYALIATNITGMGDNYNFARLLGNQQNNEFFGSQIIARPPTKKELTSYMKLTKHDTPKPFHLWKELIRAYSNEGDVILDTFSGSGTTAFVATELNRMFISFEFDEKYWKSSNERLEKFRNTIPKSLFPN